METSEAIEEIRKAISDVQSKGQDFVHIPALHTFLQSLEKDAKLSADGRKLQHESKMDWYKAQRQSDLEVFKSVISTGQTALKTSFLVNGGAAVALLAFIGNVWSKVQAPVVAKGLTSAIAFLVVACYLAL